MTHTAVKQTESPGIWNVPNKLSLFQNTFIIQNGTGGCSIHSESSLGKYNRTSRGIS